jgi:hypothetical protein
VVWPKSLTEKEKHAIATAVRSDTFKGMQLAHSKFGLDIREAKALSFHITREPSKCHRCGTPLTEEISVCAKCKSANLNW